jgi:hypothetical protein
MRRFAAIADWPLIALFALPVVLTAIGGAPIARLVYPALVALAAVRFSERDPARAITLLLWTVFLSAGIRHFNDWYGGFSQANPIMLAPYIAVTALLPQAALYLLTGQRYTAGFLALMLPVLAAFGFALVTGDTAAAALMAAMRWLLPPGVAAYLCARADALPAIRDATLRAFRLALPLIALYGIVQFAAVSPWDAYFMREAPINRIGVPKPFEVRVFATLNVPGTLATMLGMAMLLLVPGLRGWRWASILLGAATLLLTTQRAALGALVAAIAAMLIMTDQDNIRRGIGKMAVAVLVGGGVLLCVPGAAQKLTATANSVSALSQNESAQERWAQYTDLLPMLGSDVFGRGLAWASNTLYVNVGQGTPLDSGIIDILIGLGLPGGMLFLAGLSALSVQAIGLCRRAPDGQTAAESAAVLFGLMQLPFGSQHTQEDGILLFLALGLLLARRASGPSGALSKGFWAEQTQG